MQEQGHPGFQAPTLFIRSTAGFWRGTPHRDRASGAGDGGGQASGGGHGGCRGPGARGPKRISPPGKPGGLIDCEGLIKAEESEENRSVL